MANEVKGVRIAIIGAFNRLVLSHRRLKPRVADVLGEAGVARSTFYEHFDSRDSLLVEAMRGPLAAVADAAAGQGDAERLTRTLDHFRENRRGAVELLTGSLCVRIVRTLADLLGARLGEAAANGAALRLADAQIGLIRLWITGETPGSSRDLADAMIRSAAALRLAFAEGDDRNGVGNPG